MGGWGDQGGDFSFYRGTYTGIHRGTQGHTGIQSDSMHTQGYARVHRGTQGYTGIHRGTLHTGTVHRGTQGHTGIDRGTQGYTGAHGGMHTQGVQRSAQAESLVR